MTATLSAALEQLCVDQLGPGVVSDLRKLSGGASMESWRFTFQHRDLILRLRPRGLQEDPSDTEVALVSLQGQADLIRLLHERAISVPGVLAKLPPQHPLGDGFVMECVAGEALPGRILRKPEFAQAREGLSVQCAEQLAAIHSVPTDALSGDLVVKTPDVLLEEQFQYYQQFGSPNPVFELAFAWLRAGCPTPQRMTLVHADFRVGNLLVTPEDGLTSILDWELAHIGDPMRDVSFICTPSWRFGIYEQEAGGFTGREQWLADYERASGQPVDADSFQWWLVFNTLWWGVTCMRFGSAFKDGSVRTIERAVIGRRVSEVEIDLLLLLENQQATVPSIIHTLPETTPSSGDVSYRDLADSLLEWHEAAVLPTVEGHQQFEARVAGNALGIAARALSFGALFASRRAARLAALGESEVSLNQKLAADVETTDNPLVWEHLVLTALERIEIDQPHYAGARVARALWLSNDT